VSNDNGNDGQKEENTLKQAMARRLIKVQRITTH
jgi:hypothetical protein